jgi:hypothetical protein
MSVTTSGVVLNFLVLGFCVCQRIVWYLTFLDFLTEESWHRSYWYWISCFSYVWVVLHEVVLFGILLFDLCPCARASSFMRDYTCLWGEVALAVRTGLRDVVSFGTLFCFDFRPCARLHAFVRWCRIDCRSRVRWHRKFCMCFCFAYVCANLVVCESV